METSKVKVMILGVYHFNNNPGHLLNVETEDVLTEKKQEEINEVIDKLSRFNPTKILVEGRKDKDEEFMSMLEKFKENDNEIMNGETICEYFRYTNSPEVF